MNILVAGGSGFIGTYLTDFLMQQGHSVTVLARTLKKAGQKANILQWNGKVFKAEKKYDIIINLCGQNIANKRWSHKVKFELTESRLAPTKALVLFIKDYPLEIKPRLLNASAIGFYPSDPENQTETSYVVSKQKLFSKKLVTQWEACAQKATKYGAAVACLRFGVVLGKNGGMLEKILLPFKCGLGTVMGNKNASLSWIHIEDLCRAIEHLISLKDIKPVYNFTSPNPCTQYTFAKTLTKACKRPCFLRFPSFLVEKLFGQMGKELLLADQKIYPQHLKETDFKFKYNNIVSAINDILNN